MFDTEKIGNPSVRETIDILIESEAFRDWHFHFNTDANVSMEASVVANAMAIDASGGELNIKITIGEIACYTNMSDRDVILVIDELVDSGWVRRIHRGDAGAPSKYALSISSSCRLGNEW